MNCVRTCNIFREIAKFSSKLLSFNNFFMNLFATLHNETKKLLFSGPECDEVYLGLYNIHIHNLNLLRPLQDLPWNKLGTGGPQIVRFHLVRSPV